jgi:hypothetical protein
MKNNEYSRGDATGTIDTNDVPVSIGRNSEGEREHYIGRINEVATWNLDLDEDEINEAIAGVTTAIEAEGKLPTSWDALKGEYLRAPKSFTQRERWQ